MTRLALLGLLVMASSAPMQRPVPADPDDAGVPWSLAEDRAARVSNVRYDVRFEIPASEKDPVGGEVTIRFDLKEASRPLALDFAGIPGSIGPATVNGGTVTKVRWKNEHVIFDPADLTTAENAHKASFRSADGPLNRNPEFLYALFVPARARQAFPCFDQPDLKARYTLTLKVPDGWEALSNGAELGSDSLQAAQRTIRFAETKPIPTYLFTFAAGRFKV